MQRTLLALALLIGAAGAPARAETVERVVAVVNGQTILLSEWDTAARLEALLDHKPLESITDVSRRATLERRIDQELLRAEMQNSSLSQSSPDAIADRIHEIRQQYPEAATEAGWAAILAQYGVTQLEVEATVATELDDLRLIDFRLRSSAQPDSAQIARYYQSVYEPAMHAKRARPAPLADVTQQIREILTQQKLTEVTATWLQSLRAQANIQMNVRLPEVAGKPGPGLQ
jgi:parvulin-like peptidyl-prolyl isomerase